MLYSQVAVSAKLAEIEKKGRALVAGGKVTSSSALESNTFNGRAIVALLPGINTFQALESRICGPLRELEKATDLQFFMANRIGGFKQHVTLLQAEGYDGRKRLHLPAELTVQMRSLEFLFDRLILDGSGNILLCCGRIPEKVAGIRASLSQWFREQGMNPVPLESLLHSTCARISGVPAEGLQASALQELQGLAKRLNASLSQDPIGACIGDLYVGPGPIFRQLAI